MTPKQTIYEVYLWLMHEEARLESDKNVKGNFYRSNIDNLQAAMKFWIACKKIEYFKKFAADVRTILKDCEETTGD